MVSSNLFLMRYMLLKFGYKIRNSWLLITEHNEYLAQLQDGYAAWTSYLQVLKKQIHIAT